MPLTGVHSLLTLVHFLVASFALKVIVVARGFGKAEGSDRYRVRALFHASAPEIGTQRYER